MDPTKRVRSVYLAGPRLPNRAEAKYLPYGIDLIWQLSYIQLGGQQG